MKLPSVSATTIGHDMARRLIVALLAVCSWPLSTATETLSERGLEVTYVSNCGFVVECGDDKFVVDGLLAADTAPWYYMPSDSIEELMRNARPPFDNVDLIAVTHAHFDHFYADVAATHMKNNPTAVMVCPPQAEEQMRSHPAYAEIRERIHAVGAPVDSVATETVSGIRVSALVGQHSPYHEVDAATGETVDRHRNVQHLELLFRFSGRSVFHCGDALLNDFERHKKLGLGGEPIDLALVQVWRGGEQMSFAQKLVHDAIRPERIILMHLTPGRDKPGDPPGPPGVAREVILPAHLMQTWSFD